MDQKVIGGFLKELRKEKGVTQEQFAEIMGVSSRSVSRWETGSNMPDLDVLILIADYYEVELREILDGERKSEKMNQELEDTVLKVADYSTNEKRVYAGRMCVLFAIGFVLLIVYIVMDQMGVADGGETQELIAGCTLGFPLGMMLVGMLETSGRLAKWKKLKKRLWSRIVP